MKKQSDRMSYPPPKQPEDRYYSVMTDEMRRKRHLGLQIKARYHADMRARRKTP